MPVNWYAALVLIVILGIGSVALARYHYAKGTPTVAPTVGQTWHAALAFDICGTQEAPIASDSSNSTNGLTSTGSGVLLIAPKTSGEAGNHATLGKFASEYSGMKLSNTEVQYPGGKLLKNGEKCPAGTPDAGMTGVVRARSWTLSSSGHTNGSQLKQVGGHVTAAPASLKFVNRQLITVGFGPATKTLPKVGATTELALLQAVEGTQPPVTTTTVAPTATTTTAPGTTSTTAPASTTTTSAPSTTTTTKPSTTTTTKPTG